MPGGARRGAGRKPVQIDLVELEKLCSLGCNDEELAAWFGVSARTIATRKRHVVFADVIARGKSKGRIAVRRAQMRLLEAGNSSIAIWLGKQWLGQRDVTPIELSGPNGDPVRLSLETIDAIVAKSGQRTRDSSDH